MMEFVSTFSDLEATSRSCYEDSSRMRFFFGVIRTSSSRARVVSTFFRPRGHLEVAFVL